MSASISKEHTSGSAWSLLTSSWEEPPDDAWVAPKIDTSRPLTSIAQGGHNRWRSDLTPILECSSGSYLSIPTWDALNGQFTPSSTVADVHHQDTSVAHPLSGPFSVREARPGDVLEVRMHGIRPAGFGYTAFSCSDGLLRDEIDEAGFFPWTLNSRFAESAMLPKVRIANRSFVGLIGVAPSAAEYERWLDRELVAREAGQFLDAPTFDEGAIPPAGSESGLRTVPPRENGGNLDIRQLSEGSRIFLPVLVEGALLSLGDAHFAQGDGEVCGQAIEMAATVNIQVIVHNSSAASLAQSLAYSHGPEDPVLRSRTQFVSTVGMSIKDGSESRSEDLTLAAKNALIRMICLLEERGYTRLQAYAICSVAARLKVSQVVNVPHVVVSASLPLAIFEESDDYPR